MGCKLTISIHPSKSPLNKGKKTIDIPSSPILPSESKQPVVEESPDKEEPPVATVETITRKDFLSKKYVPPKKSWTPP